MTGLGTSFQVTVQSNNIATHGAPASFPSVFVRDNHGRTSDTAQDGVNVATFVPTSSLNEYTFNMNVFAGFEIWSGGVGLKTDNFCVVVH